MKSIPYKEQQYHPIRWIGRMSGYLNDHFYQTYPEFAKQIREYELRNNDSFDFTESIESILKQSRFPYSTEIGLEEYLDEMFDLVLDFFKTGQNIFHFRTELTEMLKKTDVSNVSINDIKLPYEMFYIYFGNAGSKLWRGFHLDGVYIKDLTTEVDNPIIGLLYIGSKMPNIYPENSDTKVVFEHEMHLFDILEYLESEIKTVDDNFNFSFKESTVESDIISENRKSWKPFMNNVYSLAVNSLLFLTSQPDDIQENYTERTPNSLIQKVLRAESRNDTKTKKRTESKIERGGFKKVKFVGNHLSKTIKFSKDGNSPRTHWRRGHWRNQPFGQNLSKEKLIWIKPTLVGTNDESNIEIKHLYDVDN